MTMRMKLLLSSGVPVREEKAIPSHQGRSMRVNLCVFCNLNVADNLKMPCPSHAHVVYVHQCEKQRTYSYPPLLHAFHEEVDE